MRPKETVNYTKSAFINTMLPPPAKKNTLDCRVEFLHCFMQRQARLACIRCDTEKEQCIKGAHIPFLEQSNVRDEPTPRSEATRESQASEARLRRSARSRC